MNLIALCRYITAILCILCIVHLFVNYAPGRESLAWTMQWIWTGCALTFAVITKYLNSLPTDHCAHHSKPLRNLFLALAVTVTLLLITIR